MNGKFKPKAAAAAALAIAMVLFAAGCGSAGKAPDAASSGGASASVPIGEPADASAGGNATEQDEAIQAEYGRALSAEGLIITFVGEPFFDQAIENEDDAYAAVASAFDRIGGDDTTAFELTDIRPTETGTTYYTFRQQVGDVSVLGGSVKLVVDKEKQAVGLVSAILPNVQVAPLETWEVSQEQAENVVLEQCSSEGQTSAEIVPDATGQALIRLSDETAALRYAWVVYTNNYLPEFDAGYLAHYVSADGEYLYAIPVSEPGDDESLAGEAATFPFDKLEKGTWSGTVTKHDGTTVEVSVPTLVDSDTGDVFLADGERKILCADYSSYKYEDTISARVQTDGRFSDNEILVYDSFIKVWDCYNDMGWTGPDGDRTPSLLLMDMVDKNGEVIHNAFYSGRNAGFQEFAFNRDEADGECLDIIGHEFTHCVTSTLMTSNTYVNDSGSINESMSDILGNLIEMEVAYDQDGAWLIGENAGIPLRSMKDPHTRHQPEYAWDAYYGPAVSEGTDANDNGGVHINSSLLNLISYKLSQAGMSNEDQIYYWMNVALAMTPSTDYSQLAELLPWCMEQAGFAEYVDAVRRAVDESQMTVVVAPEAPKEGTGQVRLKLPESEAYERTKVRLNLTPVGGDIENDSFMAWVGVDTDVITATVLPGEYSMSVVYWQDEGVADFYVLTEDGWVMPDDAESAGFKVFTVASEEVVELPSDGLFE